MVRTAHAGQKIMFTGTGGEQCHGVVDELTDDGTFVRVLTVGSGRNYFTWTMALRQIRNPSVYLRHQRHLCVERPVQGADRAVIAVKKGLTRRSPTSATLDWLLHTGVPAGRTSGNQPSGAFFGSRCSGSLCFCMSHL